MTEQDHEEERTRLHAELASLAEVERTLHAALMQTRATHGADGLTQLQIDLALAEQRVVGLEVMLAKHRVTGRAADASTGRRGAARLLHSLVSRPATGPSAWEPSAVAGRGEADRVTRTGSGSVDRTQLRYGSLLDGNSPARGWRSTATFGDTTLPLLQIPNVVYLPWLRLQVTDGLVVPEEVLHAPYTLEWVLATYPGDTVNDIVAEVDDDVCILSNPYSFAFGHWVSEELIKIFVLETSGFRGSYVVTPAVPGGPIPGFVLESLELMEVDPGRVITDLPGATRVRSAVFTPPINRDRARSLREVYLAYRQDILDRVGSPTAPSAPRIWQVRDAAVGSGRKSLVNEEEIVELLRPHGFEFVDMGALSLRDQISVASGATVMGGPHGSGFIHTLFQPAGSTVIECFSPNFVNTCFLEVCGILGHRYHMLIHRCAYEDYPWGLELKVDPEHLAVVLDRLGS
ncbi:MAG: glycosyltransferase family 61 protein [Actinomycetota bacterium]